MSEKTIRPLTDHVLIRRKLGAEKAGVIHIPDAHRVIPQEAEVLAVGRTCVDVKAGDVVIFGKYAGTNVRSADGTEELVMCREEDILAIVEK